MSRLDSVDYRRSRYSGRMAEEPPKKTRGLIFIFVIIAAVILIKFFPFTTVFPGLKGVLNENPDYGQMFLDIGSVIKGHIILPETFDFIMPTEGQITSMFGERTDPATGETAFHSGIDIDTPENTSVISACDGEVAETGEDAERGKYIIVKAGKEVNVVYQHLNDVYRAAGDKVTQGEEIAISGSTGKSTAPHLHLEIIKNGQPENPLDYIKTQNEAPQS